MKHLKKILTTCIITLAFAILIPCSSPMYVSAETKEVTIKVAAKAKKKTITVYKGDKVNLTVKDGKKKLKATKLTYKSASTYTAKVSKKGVITAKNTGKTKITVTTKNKKKSCIITLKVKKPVSATSLDISENEIDVNKGSSMQLHATVFPANTSDKAIEWESSDPSIATVSDTGVVTGISSGSTSIWAYNKANGAYTSDYCYVNVKGRIDRTGSAGANITYTLSGYENDLTLTLSGTGLMTNYDYDTQPWNDLRSQITRVSVGSGITSIGDRSFYFFTNCKEINIPSTVTRIGTSSFNNCNALQSLTIPSSVTTIESYAFNECTSITTLVIPSSVQTMGDEVFQDCKNLQSARVEADFTTLPEGIFWGCSNLSSVRIPAVSSIPAFCLYKVPNLTTIYYGGTQAQWESVTVDTQYNDSFAGKTIYYNS